ncbi:unnamed protein product [Gadus morhua 'NCC']
MGTRVTLKRTTSHRLDSLRRAAQEPKCHELEAINGALFDMVDSLKQDLQGKNISTLQLATHHHRAALSTGNSRESQAVRNTEKSPKRKKQTFMG